MSCGYAWLLEKFGLSALSLIVPAQASGGVSRLVPTETALLVPTRMLPGDDDIVGHLAFAVKHEGINLEVLSQVLPLVDASALQRKINERPSSGPIRKLAYLWEAFTGQRLDNSRSQGNYIALFDAEKYFTGPERQIPRWRILYNGLGPLNYCPTVRKTSSLSEEKISEVFDQLREKLSIVDPVLLQRASEWAYLSETKSSFEIEKESPSGDKMHRFIQLLKQAASTARLDEEALCNIQNDVVSNVFAKEFAYRSTQNWLANSGRSGAARVTYVPPSPEALDDLMQGLLEIVNSPEGSINPLVAAGVSSFGFVYLHPFSDGNGRISRFLIHQQLNRRHAIPQNYIVPVSAVMLKHELKYLQALESFSAPCRMLWTVIFIDRGEYEFRFNGSDATYRFWEATAQCEFLLEMVDGAVGSYLSDELAFLERYDKIYRSLNARFDVIQKDLDLLVASSIEAGRVSKNLKKKYQFKVPEAFFPALEELLADKGEEP